MNPELNLGVTRAPETDTALRLRSLPTTSHDSDLTWNRMGGQG
jgi:hypothetical protein